MRFETNGEAFFENTKHYSSAYRGWTKSSTTLKPWMKPFFVLAEHHFRVSRSGFRPSTRNHYHASHYACCGGGPGRGFSPHPAKLRCDACEGRSSRRFLPGSERRKVPVLTLMAATVLAVDVGSVVISEWLPVAVYAWFINSKRGEPRPQNHMAFPLA